MKQYDEIVIRVPPKADFVGLVRLTVSGAASKIGFDIDTIEDIKVAVSEVCNGIISANPEGSEAPYTITLHLYSDRLRVLFTDVDACIRELFQGDSGEFAYAIISSLMDEFTVESREDIIAMGKNLGDHENE